MKIYLKMIRIKTNRSVSDGLMADRWKMWCFCQHFGHGTIPCYNLTKFVVNKGDVKHFMSRFYNEEVSQRNLEDINKMFVIALQC